MTLATTHRELGGTRAALSKLVRSALDDGSVPLDELATGFEQLLSKLERKKQGAYFTPSTVARALARKTLAGVTEGVVLDPACGAGALLVAASEVVPAAVELVGVDADEDAVLLARARLEHRANVRIHHADALSIDLPRARAVIANPPFVASYARGAQKLDDERRAFLAERFPDLGAGERNAFLHFLALALEVVEPRGALGFVVPDTLLVNERYERTRRMLLRGSVEALVLDWAAFGAASVRTALLVARPSAQPRVRVRVFGDDKSLDDDRSSSEQELGASGVEERPAFAFPRGSTDPRLEAKLRARGVPLGELCWVRDGINPGPRAFRERILSLPGVPCIEGKDVQPFRIAEPRLTVATDSSLLTPALKRQGASFREAWIFDSEKLVSRQTSATLVFARDTRRLRLLNSAHATGLLPGTEEPLLYFLALLNSSALRWYYAHSSGETRRVFPQVHVSALRRLPVPRGGDSTDALVALARRLEERAARATGGSTAVTDPDALGALDEAVFELLDLGRGERNIIITDRARSVRAV